jgi:hypothetical protein
MEVTGSTRHMVSTMHNMAKHNHQRQLQARNGSSKYLSVTGQRHCTCPSQRQDRSITQDLTIYNNASYLQHNNIYQVLQEINVRDR